MSDEFRLSPEEALVKWGKIAKDIRQSRSSNSEVNRRHTESKSKRDAAEKFSDSHRDRPRHSSTSINKTLGITKADLRRVVEKTPEVVVKIAKSCKSKKDVKAYFKYLSRNGDLAIEDNYGCIQEDLKYIYSMVDDWSASSEQKMAASGGKRRETINLVLSMPPGTSEKAVGVAASTFAEKTFGDNHPYAFVQHTGESHPHVHLVVRVSGWDGERLMPGKADIRDYRETFARELRRVGVDANATSRVVRGAVKKPINSAVLELNKQHIDGRWTGEFDENGRKIRGEKAPKLSRHYTEMLETARAVASGKRELSDEEKGAHTWLPAIKNQRKVLLKEFEKITLDLMKSGNKEDKELGIKLFKFAQSLPNLETRFQTTLRVQEGKLAQSNASLVDKSKKEPDRDIEIEPRGRKPDRGIDI